MADTWEDVLGPYASGAPIPAWSVRLLEQMPKAELHLHLDGSLRVGTAMDIARDREVDAPTTWQGMTEALVGPPRSPDQASLLHAFDLPIALMQDAEALRRIVSDLVEDKAADNVRYVEIRWGPLLHTQRGLPLHEGIEAVVSGAEDASRATGCIVRLICTALRSHDPAANVILAETAVRFVGRGLTGWDYAGPEARFPDPTVAQRAFDAARAGGLRITLHAGEWGGADQVRRATAMNPERIAHGASAVMDPSVMAELRDRGICLDLCPTSNAQATIVPTVAEHPIGRLFRAGNLVTLNTDDLTVSDLTLSEEYRNAAERIGLTLPELWAIDRTALDVAFADPGTLDVLRTAFDDWAVGVPELAG